MLHRHLSIHAHNLEKASYIQCSPLNVDAVVNKSLNVFGSVDVSKHTLDLILFVRRSICDVEKNETLTVRWEAVALSFPLLGPDLNANVRECLVFSKMHQLPIKTANAATFDFDVRTRENWEIMTISLQIWSKRTKHKPSVQICHSASNLHRSTKRQISHRQAWHPPARWQIAMLLKCCLHSCKSSVNDTKTFSST
jgi:hypothetical protein